MSYKYGLIDAQYILYRNKAITSYYKEDGKVDRNDLLRLTLQSFMKLKRDYEFTYAILIWDRAPYKKAEILEQYKQDRWKPSEEQIEELEARLTEDITPEEREEIEKEIEKNKVEMYNFTILQDVKYTIINEFGTMGFKSLFEIGYEADDLAYMTAKYLYEIGETAILLTADTDWVHFTFPGIDYMSTKMETSYPELVEERDSYKSKVPDLTNYHYGILCELYEGSHNNVPEYPHNIPFDEFCDKIIHKDSSLPEYEERRKFFEAMDMSVYWDEIKDLVFAVLSDDKYNLGSFEKYCIDNSFFINFSTYNNYLDGYVGVATKEKKE